MTQQVRVATTMPDQAHAPVRSDEPWSERWITESIGTLYVHRIGREYEGVIQGSHREHQLPGHAGDEPEVNEGHCAAVPHDGCDEQQRR